MKLNKHQREYRDNVEKADLGRRPDWLKVRLPSGDNYHDSVLWYNRPWDFLMGGSRGHEGSSKNINHWFKCCLDEVRVSNVSLDSNWILTEYNNHKDPSSFYNIGYEESVP